MSGNPGLNMMVRNTIYDLKTRYGAPITVYRLTSATTNYKTGVKTGTVANYNIRKAAVLPADEVRRFFASIAFITEAKSFVSPGMQGWDQSTRGFVIDSRDIRDFEFQPEDWIVYRHKRYELESIQRLEYDTGWLVIGKELKGTDPKEIIDLNVSSTLEMDQEATNS